MDVVYAYYNADPDRARFFATNNLALPADRFHAVGGFDPNLFRAAAEDRDLCDRWLHHGQHMIFAPEAVADHAYRLTLRTFYWQHFNYGRGAWHFHQTRARRAQETSVRICPFILACRRSCIACSRKCNGNRHSGLLRCWRSGK